MNISEIWIKKPIMTTLVMLGIAFFGVLSYQSLAINNLPNIAFPTIQVTAVLPGASAEQMASNVATPLERQFCSIDGLASMSSSNQLGQSLITLQFSLSKSIDSAAQDVNTAIAAAAADLPVLPQPATFKKINPADQPILYYSLSSDTLPLSAVNDYAEVILAQNLSTIEGVSQTLIMGGQKYAVRVQVDTGKMLDRNIGVNQIFDCVTKANVNLPGGTLDSSHTTFSIDPKAQVLRAKEYNPLIVSYQNGYPVRISDIGRAIDSVEATKTEAWILSKDATKQTIILAIKKQPGANAVKVADAVKATIPFLEKFIPRSVEVEEVFDDTDFVRESVWDVQFTLVLTILIVVVIIFLFLKTLKPTVIPSLAIILSILATFIVMKILNFSLDNLSLMSLTLCVGLVVDDAIVVLENILRHVEEGSDVMTATLNGSKEIGFTIISMTTSLVVVFIPLLFMSGIIGRLFNEFAVCIAVAIAMSGVISLTFTPMICSLLIKEEDIRKKDSKLGLFLDAIFNWVLNIYTKALVVVIKHKLLSVICVFFILIATAYLFVVIPKGFLPSQDQNYFVGQSLAAESFSFPNMRKHQMVLQSIAIKDPDMKEILSVAGYNGINTGIMIFMTKSLKERKRSVNQIIDDFRIPLNSVPGVNMFLMNPPAIQIGAMNTRALYQYTLKSVDLDSLYKYVPRMLAR
ncbi:MAG: efflux RND transporter permease subunit, partial [Candidatus Margulisiibacteriota bacterium]